MHRRKLLLGIGGAGTASLLGLGCAGIPLLSTTYDYEIRMFATVRGAVELATSTFQITAKRAFNPVNGAQWEFDFVACPLVLSIDQGDLLALKEPVRRLPYPTSYGDLLYLPLLLPLAIRNNFQIGFKEFPLKQFTLIMADAPKYLVETNRLGRTPIPSNLYPEFAWIPDRDKLSSCVLCDRAHLPSVTGGLVSSVSMDISPSSSLPDRVLPTKGLWVQQALANHGGAFGPLDLPPSAACVS